MFCAALLLRSQALVDKALPPEFVHIRGLRDVVECRFFANPAPRPGRDDSAGLETWAPFSCPVAGVEMNGRHPFVVLRRRTAAARASGGAAAAASEEARDARVTVLSEKALKEVGLAALQAEYGPVAEDDVIQLVPGDAERATMVAALDARRAAERVAKADAKAAKAGAKAEAKKDQGKRKVEDGGDQAQGGSADEAQDADERRAAKKAAKAAKDASRRGPAAPKHGASVGEARAAALTGAVKHEAAAALKAAQAQNPSLQALFHGAGSQKPESAQFQFICQAGKKMGGTCS